MKKAIVGDHVIKLTFIANKLIDHVDGLEGLLLLKLLRDEIAELGKEAK